MKNPESVERQQMDVDVVCVGFGPATGGFLTTLSRNLVDENGSPRFESKIAPGLPLQVICYERADDIGFGVSGVVTKARSIQETFPGLKQAAIPMSAPVKKEEVLYLLDPIGASRRSFLLRFLDWFVRIFKWILPYRHHAVRLPFIPPFLAKHGGLVMSIGQFNQWVGSQLIASGLVQVWPGMPVKEAVVDGGKVTGVRLADQGVDKKGNPDVGYMPGMDIRAGLTVVGDGPVGPVGQQLDETFGFPEGHHQRDWAVGMKMVVELPKDCPLEAGTVIHTFGFPEPEIFGFLYVYPALFNESLESRKGGVNPPRLASLGIFIPSWFDSPVRTSYRYLQHWMIHPYLWQYLNGATLRSWGAKTLQESGKRGEPILAGDGYARIGEGSGSTNVLTGSGVDEAWGTGVQLAEGVIELLKEGKPFTKENLEAVYVKRRRRSWIEKESKVAERARDGFQRGFLPGLFGMGLSGFTGGLLNVPGKSLRPHERIPSLETYYKGKILPEELKRLREESYRTKTAIHDALMERMGWPQIPYDGKLLMSHQDALLLGGKVQAAGGYADHIVFFYPHLCEQCESKICVEICSAQAITVSETGGVPEFDREKCIHCGACYWSCAKPRETNSERSNIDFRAGSGGLHSAEN